MNERKTYTIINPATEEEIGQLPVMTQEEILGLVEKARQAQKDWAGMGLKRRLEILQACVDEITRNAEKIAQIAREETGKPFGLAMGEPYGITGRLDWLIENAEEILKDEEYSFESGLDGVIEHRPLGVVAVICPWNFPLAIAAGMFGPALVAGNTVVVKPSKETPYCMLEAAKCFKRAGLPEGVFNVITGTGAVGGQIVDAPIDMVSFTGSSEVGQRIRHALKDRFVPTALELGGNDPYLVLGEVDIDRVAQNCLDMATANCGQACCGVERVYVDETIADEFIAALKEKIARIPLATADSEEYEMGPLTTEEQLKTVMEQVDEAVAKGARILYGGKRIDRRGYFYEPTLVVDVDHSMSLMRDETFGPVISVMRVKSDEEAIELANDCEYGLSASVWCKDDARARSVASRIEAGTVWVNTSWSFENCMPWGGLKKSGVGRIMSKYGVLECTEMYAKYYGKG
jgi:succinate-semialdehyde dehydrogenase/glutarate-semialdehyde dehydrogenase